MEKGIHRTMNMQVARKPSTGPEVTGVFLLSLDPGHSRLAVLFVTTASRFKSEIHVTNGDRTVNGKSILGFLSLAAGKGTTLSVTARGEDSSQALAELESVLGNTVTGVL